MPSTKALPSLALTMKTLPVFPLSLPLKAVDEINDRFGEFTVERASIIETVLHKKTGMVASGLYKKF